MKSREKLLSMKFVDGHLSVFDLKNNWNKVESLLVFDYTVLIEHFEIKIQKTYWLNNVKKDALINLKVSNYTSVQKKASVVVYFTIGVAYL